MPDKPFTIDIDRILAEKAPNKRIPKFIISYLKKIAHQERLNRFLSNEAQGKYGVPFLQVALAEIDAHLEVEGIENLPKEGLFTFVSNHPLGGADGVSLGYVLGQFYDGNICYLVNDLIMNLKGLAPLCIPINKTGRQARDFPRMVEAGFKSNNHLIMFPAGICSRKRRGKIVDLDWKKTFISKSVETHRDVVPIHFEGRNSNFFYNLSNFCKFAGIKTNLSMLYLVDEMYKNEGKTFRITIGKPIPWETFDRSKKPKEWAKYVKDISYSLPEQAKKEHWTVKKIER